MFFISRSGKKSVTQESANGSLIGKPNLAYDSDFTYVLGDIVEKDEKLWRANGTIAAYATFTEGDSGSTWKKISGEGVELFTTGKTYKKDQVVIYDGMFFKAEKDIPSTRGFGNNLLVSQNTNGGMDSDWEQIGTTLFRPKVKNTIRYNTAGNSTSPRVLVLDSDSEMRHQLLDDFMYGTRDRWLWINPNTTQIRRDGSYNYPFISYKEMRAVMTARKSFTGTANATNLDGIMFYPGSYDVEDGYCFNDNNIKKILQHRAVRSGTVTLFTSSNSGAYWNYIGTTGGQGVAQGTDNGVNTGEARFYGITFTGRGSYQTNAPTEKPVYEECTFTYQTGQLYSQFDSLGSLTAKQYSTYKNCTFNATSSDSEIYLGGSGTDAGPWSFEGCTFNHARVDQVPQGAWIIGNASSFKNNTFNTGVVSFCSTTKTSANYNYNLIGTPSAARIVKPINCTFNSLVLVDRDIKFRDCYISRLKVANARRANVNGCVFQETSDSRGIIGGNDSDAFAVSRLDIGNPAALNNTSHFAMIDSDGFVGKSDFGNAITYNSTRRYAAGDIVYRQGTLWRANGTINPGVSFANGSSGATWGQITAGGALADYVQSTNGNATSIVLSSTKTQVASVTISSTGVWDIDTRAMVEVNIGSAATEIRVNGVAITTDLAASTYGDVYVTGSGDYHLIHKSEKNVSLNAGDTVTLHAYEVNASAGYRGNVQPARIEARKVSGYIPILGYEAQHAQLNFSGTNTASASTLRLITSAAGLTVGENSGLTINPTTGEVTLKAGVTYRLGISVGLIDSGGSSTVLDTTYAWRNTSTSTDYASALVISFSYSDRAIFRTGQGEQILTPTSDIIVRPAQIYSTNTASSVVSFTVEAISKQLPITTGTVTETLTIGATTTAPTKATVKQHDYITLFDDGSGWCDVEMCYSHGSATGATSGFGTYLFSLPGGYAFDTTYHPLNTQTGTLSGAEEVYKLIPGQGMIQASTAYSLSGNHVIAHTPTTFKINANTPTAFGLLNSGYFAFGVANVAYKISFRFKKA